MKHENYTNPPIDDNYLSNATIETNEALENSVIKLSRVFLDSLFSDHVLPQEIIDQLVDDPEHIDDIFIDNENLAQDLMDWSEGSRSFFIALIIGLIFTCFMTIIGIIWCISRCCCGCGKGKKNSAGDAFTQSWILMHEKQIAQ